MVTVISRIIHYGFKNFWRNGLLSTATTAIVTLCLIVFAGIIFSNAMTEAMVNFLKDKIDVSVYFKLNTPEDEILAIKTSLEKLPEVKAAEYISQDKALEIFRARHADNEEIGQIIDELGTNPLWASLNVKAKDPQQYGAIAQYLETPASKQYIAKISYDTNQDAINNLVALIKNVNRGGLLVTIILALIAGLVVFNTIRLVIYSNRDEIAIMRAVGASNAFVRGPFVMEGIVTGLIAAFVSLLLILIGFLLMPFFYQNAYFDFSIPGFSPLQYFYQNFFRLLGYQVLFGVVLTAFSSFIAVRRYLRN